MTRFRQIWNPGCYSSLTNPHRDWHKKQFQCPLGLELLRHGTQAQCCDKQGFNALSGLYLISTLNRCFRNISKCLLVSMPSRAYTSFLLGKATMMSMIQIVSMPSRAYTSFLRYPFKNLGFMRFPEPVFAGIYQNILTTVVFRAC